MWSRSPARSAGWRSSTTRSAPTGGSATLVPLDLKDYEGIDRLGAALHERYGRLDILVGNAGILGPLSPLGHVEPKAWDEVMAVNVTANWRLIRAMDPLLQVSDAGRVVFVILGRRRATRAPIGGPTRSPRRRSKRWRAPMRPRPRRPRCGSICSTRARSAPACAPQAMPGEDPMTLETPEQVAGKIVELCLPSMQESGKIYAYPTRKLLEFQRPA